MIPAYIVTTPTNQIPTFDKTIPLVPNVILNPAALKNGPIPYLYQPYPLLTTPIFAPTSLLDLNPITLQSYLDAEKKIDEKINKKINEQIEKYQNDESKRNEMGKSLKEWANVPDKGKNSAGLPKTNNRCCKTRNERHNKSPGNQNRNNLCCHSNASDYNRCTDPENECHHLYYGGHNEDQKINNFHNVHHGNNESSLPNYQHHHHHPYYCQDHHNHSHSESNAIEKCENCTNSVKLLSVEERIRQIRDELNLPPPKGHKHCPHMHYSQ